MHVPRHLLTSPCISLACRYRGTSYGGATYYYVGGRTYYAGGSSYSYQRGERAYAGGYEIIIVNRAAYGCYSCQGYNRYESGGHTQSSVRVIGI